MSNQDTRTTTKTFLSSVVADAELHNAKMGVRRPLTTLDIIYAFKRQPLSGFAQSSKDSASSATIPILPSPVATNISDSQPSSSAATTPWRNALMAFPPDQRSQLVSMLISKHPVVCAVHEVIIFTKDIEDCIETLRLISKHCFI